ncbi:MAG: ATP-grasp domain-containing protein [Bacteroidetes bacterium]|nr:ATP-grasp domain-containing protein [Bacteroidota bacterium]
MQEWILVFGGGLLQLSLLNRAKLMGYNTIVIDPDANAPGSKTSDLFFQVAGDDYKKTIQIAKKYCVKGIITAATDKPILMMCRIAKELDLPFPTYKSCETVLDKAKFKKFLEENDFPHAHGKEYKGIIRGPLTNINFPLIIKPVMNSGSRGVIKCDKVENFQNSIKESLYYCKDERYLIEEFIEGDEISVEAIVQMGKVHILQITDKIVTLPPYNVELGHLQPSKFENQKPAILNLLQKIVDKSGLDNCALHPEMKIIDDRITIIEIGPRLGGDFITSHLVPLSTGVNIEDLLINIAVGNVIDYKPIKKASLVSYLNFTSGGKVTRTISEVELMKKFPSIETLNINLKIGEIIRPITNSLNRYGQFVLTGNNSQTLLKQKDEIQHFLEEFIIN